jgi:serine/threonine protein kinase
MSNPQIYDSGNKITLFYRRNQNEPDAVENKILDSSYLTEDKNDAVWDVVNNLLPNIPHFYPTITSITIKTVGGKLTADFAEDVDELINYLPIPSHLSHILTVPISELRKVEWLDMDVDRVKWKGETYAFKKTGQSLEGTLRELTILDKLSKSPCILGLRAIVVNRDNTIRGFLSPFIHAGDLENIFCREQKKRGFADAADAPCFDWPLKLSWACQITRGVVELHSISAYNGDLKPKNVLIGPEGHAILIDFLPMGISEPFAAPEVREKCHDGVTEFGSVLTASADIYSLGILLYVVVEEKVRNIHPIAWRDGVTGFWYREIVERCLASDPEARPSASEVLSLLEKFRGPL